MGDDRRNEGSGAVVAIVLIIGIVVLLGVLVVVGGAFFFLASSSDVQVMTTAMPAPTVSASAPAASNAEPGDLAPVELDGDGTSVVDQESQLEVHADGTITLSGLQLPLEDLKMKLAKMKEADETLKVKLAASQSLEAVEVLKELQEFLKLHSIAIEPKQP